MKNVMQQAMQHDVAWEYEENRRKIHEILDIVLDTNTLERRTSGETGTLPTTYFSFSGISGCVKAELYPNGWSGGTNSEVFSFYTDEEISQERIDTLRKRYGVSYEEADALYKQLKADGVIGTLGYVFESC